MNQNKLSSRVRDIMKSAVAAAALPIFFLYIMIAKPDYTIMNAMSHVVVPVARWTGGVITWPVRATGNLVRNARELSRLRAENEELRDALDVAMRDANTCAVAIAENQKLNRELDIVNASPRGVVIADVVFDTGAFNSNTVFINRGSRDGIARGNAVVSMDNSLIGLVIDVTAQRARIRTLTDSDLNIAVRVAGSEVYGFLTGNGSLRPSMGFFSDPEFQPSAGVRLVTSSISGVLPGGIYVGTMINDQDVQITNPGAVSRVMVLQFDTEGEYK